MPTSLVLLRLPKYELHAQITSERAVLSDVLHMRFTNNIAKVFSATNYRSA